MGQVAVAGDATVSQVQRSQKPRKAARREQRRAVAPSEQTSLLQLRELPPVVVAILIGLSQYRRIIV